jgi:hypothetical protein
MHNTSIRMYFPQRIHTHQLLDTEMEMIDPGIIMTLAHPDHRAIGVTERETGTGIEQMTSVETASEKITPATLHVIIQHLGKTIITQIIETVPRRERLLMLSLITAPGMSLGIERATACLTTIAGIMIFRATDHPQAREANRHQGQAIMLPQIFILVQTKPVRNAAANRGLMEQLVTRLMMKTGVPATIFGTLNRAEFVLSKIESRIIMNRAAYISPTAS